MPTGEKVKLLWQNPEYRKKVIKGIKANLPRTAFKKGNKRNFKTGRIKNAGYIFIYKPEHPFCEHHGYIREHRLVIEKYLGRYLKPEEVGHHLGKKDDNHPHMLMAFVNHSAHIRFERGNKINPSEIIFDGRKIHQVS